MSRNPDSLVKKALKSLDVTVESTSTDEEKASNAPSHSEATPVKPDLVQNDLQEPQKASHAETSDRNAEYKFTSESDKELQATDDAPDEPEVVAARQQLLNALKEISAGYERLGVATIVRYKASNLLGSAEKPSCDPGLMEVSLQHKQACEKGSSVARMVGILVAEICTIIQKYRGQQIADEDKPKYTTMTHQLKELTRDLDTAVLNLQATKLRLDTALNQHKQGFQ
jgi:hypothetical protein